MRINHKNIGRAIWIYYILIVLTLVILTLTSCNSKSGQLTQTPKEKVVIVELQAKNTAGPKDGPMYRYKVNRIEKGVVDIIYEYHAYAPGDTIFHRFNQ